MYCPKCGKETDTSGQFCQWCGAPIEAGELAVTTNVTAVYALRPADAPDAPEGMDMPEGEAEAAPAN